MQSCRCGCTFKHGYEDCVLLMLDACCRRNVRLLLTLLALPLLGDVPLIASICKLMACVHHRLGGIM